MKIRHPLQRRLVNIVMLILSSLSALIGIIALAWILYDVIKIGGAALNLALVTELPAPPGVEGGGLANALLGTAMMTFLATVLGVPIGMLGGIYLAEFGRKNRFGAFIRFATNVLMGIPSIIVGLFVYTIVVMPMGRFSGYAGAVALAIIILPIVGRTTEDMLNLVPNALRESALALGAPRWRVTLGIVFRSAKVGLITGGLLAVARVSGETAPLLFTALNSPFWPDSILSMDQPTANLTVTIFNYAMSPYVDWQRLAWGASLLITAGVLTLIVIARLLSKEVKR
jgi:phosphate transport system permease protein